MVKLQVRPKGHKYDMARPKQLPRRRRRLVNAAAFAYTVATASCSVLYLVVLSPSISNDHWWPHFNATGTQTFLGDLYNARLATMPSPSVLSAPNGRLDLFAASSLVVDDYASPTSTVNMRPAAARAILLAPLPLAEAIRIMRSIDFFENMRTLAPSCWLDFHRTFEMAHTARHQVMCNARRRHNAAMYLESLLRNLDGQDLRSSTYFPGVQSGIFDAAEATEDGARWVDAILRHRWLPVADEVAKWQSHGITTFQNQLQNLYEEGLSDSVTISNALGLHQRLTTNSIPFTNRPKGAWSTVYSFCGFWNDLDACAQTGSSMVRSAPNAFDAGDNSWDMYYNGPAGTPATALIRSHLGPLSVIDIFLVTPPSSVHALATGFLDTLFEAVLPSPNMYLSVPEVSVTAAPSSWQRPNAVYYGGNPVCCYGNPVPYVQPSFGYYDDCGVQVEHKVVLTRDSVLFAMFASGIVSHQLASVCEQTTSAAMFATCMQTMVPAHDVFTSVLGGPASPLQSLASLVVQTTQDIVPLNVSFVQWATIDGVDQVLHQAMVSSGRGWTDPWSFFGWMTLFEWANGQREVFSFEGDYDTYVLMTRPHPFTQMVSNPVELPQNACKYLWVVCIYVTSILLLVVGLLWLYGLQAPSKVDGRNLFQLNRLVGGAWIGRPFLFLRAMTAILVLSTCHVDFVSMSGLSKFEFSPRPLWHTLVLAGEATWITYTLNDICVPFTGSFSAMYSPWSTMLAWVVLALIEVAAPYRADATIGRRCSIVSFTRGVHCTSGEIHIGSPPRVLLLLTVTVGSAVVSFGMVATATAMVVRLRPPKQPSKHVLLPSSSEAFLLDGAADSTHVDVLACVLSGILPIQNHLFDVKIWVAFRATRVSSFLFSLPNAALHLLPPAATDSINGPPSQSTKRVSFYIRSTGFLGLLYILWSVVSSYLYLAVSRTTLANDFLWLGFNDTNTQSFVCNWFNKQLQYGNESTVVQARIDDPRYGSLALPNNVTASKVSNSALYAISIQDEANSLANVISSLRRMDGCGLPWLSTAYCYVDFAKTWEMAHTATRQRRCRLKQQNAAVFLEAGLRNVPWSPLMSCWGPALDAAVFAPLRDTMQGRDWIATLQHHSTTAETPTHPLLAVADEVEFWLVHGLTQYTTQWQNYKSLGVTETFVVPNALGVEYPVTVKSSNGSFHLSAATSFRMFWPFANDLTEVAANRTFLGGKSLVRHSATYAFANSSYFEAMVDTGVLVAPLDPALAIFQNTVGAFGVVDLKRVAVPAPLTRMHRRLTESLMATLSRSNAVQDAFWAIYTVAYFTPQPKAWDAASIWGGDVLCGRNYGGSFSIPFQFFSANGLCGNFLNDYIAAYTTNIVLSVLASGLDASSASAWRAIAERDRTHFDATVGILNGSVAFIGDTIAAADIAPMRAEAMQVKQVVRDTLNLELVQYLSADNDETYVLSRVNMFADADMEFFAWLYLFEWVEGKREVVTFEGDVDTLTTLSTVQNYDERPVNTLEIPLNVSYYFLMLIQYITAVLFGVGMLVCVYILSSRGYIEGTHMISFNFIAGHVWCGRTLVLLRGLTAIALLATSNLSLIRPHSGLVAHFESPDRFWGATLLSAGEMSWLTYVIVDTFSVFSGHFTSAYCALSTFLVCLVAAIWSFAAPTTHLVTVGRRCAVAALDWDVVCSSGRVEIGDASRFHGLVGLGFGGCLVSYALTRLWYATHPLVPLDHVSYLLHSAAKHTFEDSMHASWVHNNVFYIDKASAALTGILSIEWNTALFILDIKMWRVYKMSTPPPPVDANGRRRSVTGALLPPHLVYAIPLLE